VTALAREEMFRPSADGGLELTPHGVRMLEAMRTEAAAATKKALLKNNRRLPQQETDRNLKDAAKEMINRVEAVARKTLQAHPYSEPPTPFPERANDDAWQKWKEEEQNQKWLEEEEKWRELAYARRQLAPLLDALAKADEPNSEYAKYRPGFLTKLFDAMATITEFVGYDWVRPIQARKDGSRGGRPKKAGEDAFDTFALECFSKLSKHATPATAPAVWSLMISKIENDCADASLSAEDGGDRIALIDARGRELRLIRKSSFSTILSRLKPKPSTKPGFR
jgi:hypothetical protein